MRHSPSDLSPKIANFDFNKLRETGFCYKDGSKLKKCTCNKMITNV